MEPMCTPHWTPAVRLTIQSSPPRVFISIWLLEFSARILSLIDVILIMEKCEFNKLDYYLEDDSMTM